MRTFTAWAVFVLMLLIGAGVEIVVYYVLTKGGI